MSPRKGAAGRCRPWIAACAVGTMLAVAGPASAQTSVLQLVPVGRGTITMSPASADDKLNCPGAADQLPLPPLCDFPFTQGQQVTLTATPNDPEAGEAPSSFVSWSDDRCPSGPVCTVTLDTDRLSIAALFTPQRVSVVLNGVGSVTSTPPGVVAPAPATGCENADAASSLTCAGDFPLFSTVVLTASDTATWLPRPPTEPILLPLCDQVIGVTCTVTADRPRWGSVGFGIEPVDQVPPQINVRFRILKAGGGSGTVRGTDVDCGSTCTTVLAFGATQALVAEPDAGSRFVQWRSACGAQPRCSLPVGPVTAVTAVFERAGAGPPAPQPSQPSRAFAARLLRVDVRGHGRRRTVLFRVDVNAAARVRATLQRGHRRVASHRWQVSAGSHLLRLRVPARAHRGTYRFALVIAGPGPTVRLSRRIRIGR